MLIYLWILYVFVKRPFPALRRLPWLSFVFICNKIWCFAPNNPQRPRSTSYKTSHFTSISVPVLYEQVLDPIPLVWLCQASLVEISDLSGTNLVKYNKWHWLIMNPQRRVRFMWLVHFELLLHSSGCVCVCVFVFTGLGHMSQVWTMVKCESVEPFDKVSASSIIDSWPCKRHPQTRPSISLALSSF